MVQQLSGAERAAVELYVQSLNDPDALKNADSKITDQTIEAAAKEAGILTNEDIRAFVDALTPPPSSEEKAAILARLEGNILLNPGVLNSLAEGQLREAEKDPANKATVEKVRTVLAKPDGSGYFNQVLSGNISKETAVKIRDAIRKGDISQIALAALEDKPTATEEEKAANAAKRDEISLDLKTAVGIGGIALLLLVLSGVSSVLNTR